MFAELNELEKERTIIEFITCNLWIFTGVCMQLLGIKQYLAHSLLVVRWMHAMFMSYLTL